MIVYKIGGSLLSMPDLGERLITLISNEPNDVPLLVVGGGEVTNVVRKWDDVHQLEEETSHQLALQSLVLNESLLLILLPQAKSVSTIEEAETTFQAEGIPLLATSQFLAHTEPTSNIPLPHCWKVTSDSIAAWVAIHASAKKLVLVKSIDQPKQNWEQSDTVDDYFSELMPLLPNVDWVNLRSPG